MDWGIAFLLGLLGGLHCAAMCGPLMLALPASSRGAMRFLAGRGLYQLGRIGSYCLLGLAAGGVGKSLYLAGLQRWLCIVLGVAVLAGFLVSRRIVLGTPVRRLVGLLQSAMLAYWQRPGLSSLAVLGMLNGLLPCGLVYVALAGAVSQDSLISGMGYMAVFGLGTVPTMMGISLAGNTLPLPVRLRLRPVIPIGVCLLAGLLILRGLSLGIPYVSPDLGSPKAGCCSR